MRHFVAACRSLLHLASACCSLLQFAAACCSLLQFAAPCCGLSQLAATCCSLPLAAACGSSVAHFINSIIIQFLAFSHLFFVQVDMSRICVCLCVCLRVCGFACLRVLGFSSCVFVRCRVCILRIACECCVFLVYMLHVSAFVGLRVVFLQLF